MATATLQTANFADKKVGIKWRRGGVDGGGKQWEADWAKLYVLHSTLFLSQFLGKTQGLEGEEKKKLNLAGMGEQTGHTFLPDHRPYSWKNYMGLFTHRTDEITGWKPAPALRAAVQRLKSSLQRGHYTGCWPIEGPVSSWVNQSKAVRPVTEGIGHLEHEKNLQDVREEKQVAMPIITTDPECLPGVLPVCLYPLNYQPPLLLKVAYSLLL